MMLLLFICLFNELIRKALSHKNDQEVLPGGSDGFVRVHYYASAVCRGSVSLERGYYADYCYRAGDGDYFKFHFTTGLYVQLGLLMSSLFTNTRYSTSQCRGLQRLSNEALCG